MASRGQIYIEENVSRTHLSVNNLLMCLYSRSLVSNLREYNMLLFLLIMVRVKKEDKVNRNSLTQTSSKPIVYNTKYAKLNVHSQLNLNITVQIKTRWEAEINRHQRIGRKKYVQEYTR